jgi:hypothetical protein
MLLEDVDDGGWLDRGDSADLVVALMDQLRRARAALFYFRDLVDDRERRNEPEGPIVTMPSWPAEPEHADWW